MAFVIGGMAVFAGGKVVLFGILPNYYVIKWLPIYNFNLGLISIFPTSVIIWKNNKVALPLAMTIFGLHTVVMLLLQSAYRHVVAPDSITAMIVRLLVWAIILSLLILQKRKKYVIGKGVNE